MNSSTSAALLTTGLHSTPTELEKVDILLVDDRPDGLVTIEAVLKDPSYNLIKAGSGREALGYVLNHDFAVILMDVQMPDMDGFETARMIKQRDRSKHVPIIFVTAINKADEFVSLGYEAGAADYLFKPFDPAILKSKIAVFVDLYRKNNRLQRQTETLREMQKRETARVLADLEVESRRRYQSLADAIPLIVWRANDRGTIDYYNQFFHLFSGLSPEEARQGGWKEVVHQSDWNAVSTAWTDAMRTGSGFEAECRVKQGQTGEFRWHLLRVIPDIDSGSQLNNWIGTATDIHDQKLLLQQLIQAKEQADAASEAKTRFLANMSHEIRTPLGAMIGFTELLVTHNLTDKKKKEYSATIKRNGEQLSRIIDEILDLSRVEAGKIKVDRTEINLVDLLNDVKSMMNLQAEDKGLGFDFAIEAPVPARITTDQLRLRQILTNIIGNGIKFSSKGRVTVNVGFEVSRKGDNILYARITDSGPGLTTEQIHRLFQPFSQIDNPMSRKFGGTGLGLALSRRFANALGGDVVVSESPPGKGCTFLVTVETGAIDSSKMVSHLDRGIPEAEIKFEQKGTCLLGFKVLLVEDSKDNQELVSNFLQIAGAEVDFANNGEEGIEKALAGDHDLVLMDIQMPVLDGYAATRNLRKLKFKKPIIAFTAHAMKEERDRCLSAGCNEHLTKPVNRVELIERVSKYTIPQVVHS